MAIKQKAEIRTLLQARKILERKLTFGDDEQIRAVRFIEQAEGAMEAYGKCNIDHRRSDDNGRGDRIFRLTCDCLEDYEPEIRNAARYLWNESNGY